MTHRSYALALIACLWLAQPAFAQEEAAAPASGSIDNEMPPGDPPKVKKEEPTEAPPAEGSIRDVSEKRRPYAVSLMGALPWLYGVGGGVRVAGEIPILHNGFIPGINDSFSLEPMFEYSYGRQTYSLTDADEVHGSSLTPALSILWSFYFKSNLRAYANITLGYAIVLDDWKGVGNLNLNHFYHNFAVGVFYDFAKHWAFRGEVGYEGLRAGIAFLI